MRFEYRITKYNPKYRDKNGSYNRDDWTEYSDIGKVFAGKRLSKESYEIIESNYIKSVIMILSESGINEMTLCNLENRSKNTKWADNATIGGAQIKNVCKDILRGKLWAKLHAHRHAYVHFGWDYYMYVGSSTATPGALESIRTMGLFCEEFHSPYK